jgi:hypothetical protein
VFKFTLYKQFLKKYWKLIISSDLVYSIDYNNMPYPSYDEIVHIGFCFGIINKEIKNKTNKWFYVTDFVTKIIERKNSDIIFQTNSNDIYKLSITKEKLYLRKSHESE